MSALARRKVLLGGAAMAVAALGVSGAPKAASAANTDHLMDLWRRFIAAEVQFSDAYSAQDAAEWNARQETGSLTCPWTPMGDNFKCETVEDSERRKIFELIRQDVTMRQGGLGPWLVWEYQPLAANHPFVKRRSDGDPLRWQPYPEANSAEEAYATATARSEKEWRSFDGKRSAISRKHQVRKFEAGVETASDVCCNIRREIAKVPVTGALALAIKLGVWGYGNDIDLKSPMAGRRASNFEDIETASLVSLYRHAVLESGFDPLARAHEAMRKHYKVIAKRERDHDLAHLAIAGVREAAS
jgi:hypothetical protein